MSTYKKITKHPQTSEYEIATYKDDFFGPHIYGVYFESDQKTYPVDLVDGKAIKNFWHTDVILAFIKFLYGDTNTADSAEDVVEFLNLIQDEYANRWEADSVTGNGATMDGAE